MLKCLALLALLSGGAFAQQYEVGATVGYGICHDGTIFSSEGTAEAGIRNRFAAGISLVDEFSKYVSAEFDYLYHDGHPFLMAPRREHRHSGKLGCADGGPAVPLQAAGTSLASVSGRRHGRKGVRYRRSGAISAAHPANRQPDNE